MLIQCPACQSKVQLTKLQCQKCRGVIDVDQCAVAGQTVAVCPGCGAQQGFGRLRCNTCKSIIHVATATVQEDAPAAEEPPAPAQS